MKRSTTNKRRYTARIWLALLLTLLLLQGVAHTVHGSSYSDAVLVDSPVEYYRVGDSSGTTAVDASGNGHNGTYTGGVTLGAVGAIQGDANTAISLDGVNDYISLPGIGLQDHSFSFEVWIKPSASSPPSQEAVFISTNAAVTQVAAMRIYATGAIDFEFIDAGITAGTITFGAWNYIVYTYNYASDTSILYVNGAARASNNIGPYTASSVDYSNIGCTLGNEFFKGSLDEVALYLSALSAERVAAHYVVAGYSLSPTSTPSPTATETLTPTPAPWALATIPGTGLIYQVSYEAGVGELAQILLAVVMCVLLAYIGFQMTRRAQ